MKCLFAVLLTLCLAAPLRAQNAASMTPLARFLGSDGTLRTPAGFQGSLDPAGWKMKQSGGAPVFAPLSVPTDTGWYAGFDSAGGMDSPVYAVAVSGTDVYVGGQFTSAGGVPDRKSVV